MDVVIGLESPITPPTFQNTHTHTCTYTHKLKHICTNNAEEHTDIFYLELNVMDRILILVQTGLNFVVW